MIIKWVGHELYYRESLGDEWAKFEEVESLRETDDEAHSWADEIKRLNDQLIELREENERLTKEIDRENEDER